MSLILKIKVIPSSGKQMFKLDKSDILKIYLKSPPERNLANKELIKLLAKNLNLTHHNFMLISGESARTKLVKIETSLTFKEVLAKLEIDYQTSLF